MRISISYPDFHDFLSDTLSYCHVLCRVERRLFLGCDRFDGRADALLWPAKIVYPPAVVLPPHTPLCRAFTAASHASRIAAILETSGSILESGEFTCASTMTKPIGDPNLLASQPLVRRQLFRMRFLRRLVGYVSAGGDSPANHETVLPTKTLR